MSLENEVRTPCPFCSEKISQDAKKCRYCGEWLQDRSSIDKVNTPIAPKKRFSVWIVLLAILILGFLFKNRLIQSTRGGDLLHVTTLQPTEDSLRRNAEEQYQLIQSRDRGNYERLYYSFYTPENKVKSMTIDEFYNKEIESYVDGTDHKEYVINSVSVKDKKGYVDRTIKLCANAECTKIKAQDRSIRVYYWMENRWLMADDSLLCNRDNPYENPPEFERVYSLILQRTSSFQTSYDLVRNCVVFRYADSDEKMEGAEGMFHFRLGQSLDKMEILISPRYKIKDDLVTAVLVIHELQHVIDYANGLQTDKEEWCYQTEANAFNNQNWFITILNQEEKSSIIARLSSGGSEELQSINNVYRGIANAYGKTNEDKALNFVKSMPAYQKQCSGK